MYKLYCPMLMGGRSTILTKLVQRVTSGLLMLFLALAPAVAEESAAEKNESIERYILEDEQVARKVKRRGSVISLSIPVWVCGPSILQADTEPHLGHPKLFILYNNLKLCD